MIRGRKTALFVRLFVANCKRYLRPDSACSSRLDPNKNRSFSASRLILLEALSKPAEWIVFDSYPESYVALTVTMEP